MENLDHYPSAEQEVMYLLMLTVFYFINPYPLHVLSLHVSPVQSSPCFITCPIKQAAKQVPRDTGTSSLSLEVLHVNNLGQEH